MLNIVIVVSAWSYAHYTEKKGVETICTQKLLVNFTITNKWQVIHYTWNLKVEKVFTPVIFILFTTLKNNFLSN